ncbi:MAG: serine hydrolase domain-containing protein [Pseudomonadota bacterium]
MTNKQSILETAVANGDAPFLVAMQANSAGVTWQGAAGEAAPGMAAAPDTVHRIFSMTKAVGSVAAMMLIDRGKLGIDDPVDKYLPEAAAKLRVLDGWDGETPIYRAPATMPTIRQLSTHTSGLVYEFWCPEIGAWMQKTGHPTIVSGTNASLDYAMAFDPGARWDYGIGIDWLGKVVEAIDGRRIDVFLQEELLGPLGMSDTACEVADHMAPRLASVKARGDDGVLADFEMAPPSNPEFYGMGHALYSTPADYLTFLRLFLNRGTLNGQKILSEGAADRMLENSIGDLRVGKMISLAPPMSADVELFPGTPMTHSFGFVRNEEDVPGMRTAGSQGWAGVLNSHYWFDPAKDVAAVIMTQSLPFAEPRFMDVYEAFETAVYSEIAA